VQKRCVPKKLRPPDPPSPYNNPYKR
jgi:hypothetical protein